MQRPQTTDSIAFRISKPEQFPASVWLNGMYRFQESMLVSKATGIL